MLRFRQWLRIGEKRNMLVMDIEWIRKGLQKHGKTQRGLAVALGIDPSGVNRILKGTRLIKADELKTIADYLDEPLPPEALAGNRTAPPSSEALKADISIPLSGELPLSLPVYGVAMGGPGDAFYLNGQVVDYVRRPPGLALAPKAFGVYVQGTSMEPRYEEGDLVIVNPARPARVGDYALIELFPTSAEGEVVEVGPAFVKRLVRKTASEVICEQLNPRQEVRYPANHVRHIYRVLSIAELFGAG